MIGFHWRVGLHPLHVNIPYWPHRVIVIGRGRLTSGGQKFHPWQPCAYRMQLHHCCPGAPPEEVAA